MDKLRDYLDKRGMRQNFFAEKLGISASSLNAILNKSRAPTLPQALLIDKCTNGMVSLKDCTEYATELKKTKKLLRQLIRETAMEPILEKIASS